MGAGGDDVAENDIRARMKDALKRDGNATALLSALRISQRTTRPFRKDFHYLDDRVNRGGWQ